MTSTLRLILWPTLITGAISTLRLVAEVQSWVTPRSGRFGPFLDAEPTEATFMLLRESVFVLVGIATTLAVIALIVWPKQAWTMLCYAVPARATVLAFTWLAKQQGWNTHYTKFGPPGIERPLMADTMTSAAIAQLGFWVPFTIVAGTFAGSLLARRHTPR